NLKIKKRLINKVSLTSEQKREIDEYYKKYYGKKVKHHWHRLYQSYTGVFRKDYFPEILLSSKLELVLNPVEASNLLGDKNLLKQLFGSVEEVHIPETYASCVNGVLKDGNHNIISSDYIKELVKNKSCVIKKTIETSSGRDVMICNFEDGTDVKSKMTVDEIINEMGKNFVVQERVSQFKELSDLYPDSLNTFRVMTYIVDGEIYHCPLALRLARNGADRDNIHYGGICVGVDDDGSLYEKAFEEFGNSYEVHPDTKITFKGYKLSNIDKLISCAKKLHACIPMLGIVSWDLTFDENGKVTIIEANTFNQSAWFPQMIQGKALFGEHTPYMLSLISK
ncbi:MAG: hypothetical protein II978_07440, partial [Clostridia bacterium]|nr:hypothetical protein [Clostridia bacterium]